MILLLIIIYITFISLGLPDSMLGAVWPVVYKELAVSESFASIFSAITTSATAVISFIAGSLIRKHGTVKVTLYSIVATIIGMFGISIAPNIYIMLLFAIILGMGGGAIDTGLNAFVSLHYSSKHMNWLHCFWGVGVSISPLIISIFLRDNNWRMGYVAIACIQCLIFVIVFAKRGLWKLVPEINTHKEIKQKLGISQILKKPGIKFSILSIGIYCGMEFLIGIWGASYLVHMYNLKPDAAARWVSIYFMGIMSGRFLSGFVSDKIGDKNMIYIGQVLSLIGMLILALPIGKVAITGYFLIGLGFGPIFPAIIHSIPSRFGHSYSSDITGYHMSGAYIVGFSAQILFGYIATAISFIIMPYTLIGLCLLLMFCSTGVYWKINKVK